MFDHPSVETLYILSHLAQHTPHQHEEFAKFMAVVESQYGKAACQTLIHPYPMDKAHHKESLAHFVPLLQSLSVSQPNASLHLSPDNLNQAANYLHILLHDAKNQLMEPPSTHLEQTEYMMLYPDMDVNPHSHTAR